MHHKSLVIDAKTPFGLLVTGSANLTLTGLDENHNHMLFVRGAPAVLDAFTGELAQLYDHCRSAKVGTRQCTECTPGCMQAPSSHGPFSVGGASVEVHFSPTNKLRTTSPLDVLRGETKTVKRATPDPACVGPDASCVCRASGSGYLCDYCGQQGWGLIGQATRRIVASLFIVTDQCFALALGRAAGAGLETSMILNYAEAGSPYSRDEFVCGLGVEVYRSNWGPLPAACSAGQLTGAQWASACYGDVMVRNHNKAVVVDDAVFDGSLNISVNGVTANDEATLIVKDAKLAQRFADYIAAEIALLQSRGVSAPQAAACRCADLVDNDGDGLLDAADPDCDAGTSQP